MPEFLPDQPLASLHTFAMPATARWLATATTVAGLREILADPRGRGLPRLILGGGSNLLFRGDFPGLVIRIALAGVEVEELGDDGVRVTAGAGENWHGLVAATVGAGVYGLENLALIPGTVGAAPIQNIGAYGVEAGEFIEAVEVLDAGSGETRWIAAADCRFAYRHSLFKEAVGRDLIVTRVRFRLSRRPAPRLGYAELARELEGAGVAPTPEAVLAAVVAIRRRKLPDPAEIGNAGSFFKNPLVDAAVFAELAAREPGVVGYPQPDGRVKVAAGWLIDRCGWKGRSVGRAGVYERQALVLVNRGGASGAEIWALAEAIRADVRRRFGVELEPEPVVIG